MSHRVLVVRIGAMGDVLHGLPAVAALRAAEPTWKIGWAVDRRWASLLVSAGEISGPVVDRIHQVDTRAWKARPVSLETIRSVLALRKELGSEGYDVCLDLQGTIRSAVIGRMAGTERFVGSSDPRERLAGWLYDTRVETLSMHVVDRAFELAQAVRGAVLVPARIELPRDGAAERWAEEVTRGLGAFVFLAPTAGWGAKAWPEERYGALARALRDAGYSVLVNASGNGDRVAAAVEESSGGAARTVVSDVGQMIALLRRAGLVLAGDTGPLHLADTLGRPVLGLFGPTDPERNGPRGAEARVLRHPASVRDHSRRTATEAGLMQIGVDEVVGTAVAMLTMASGSRGA